MARTMEKKTALSFKSVKFHYELDNGQTKVPILDGIDFEIQDGEFITIIGPSGSGKSTMFRLVTGLEQPTAGSIEVNGVEEVNRLSKVGYMPQKDLLLPWRSILENAMLPLEIKGVPKQEAKEQVLSMLE